MRNQIASVIAIACLIAGPATIKAASPVIVDANGNVLAFYSTGIGAGAARGVTTEGFTTAFEMKTGAVSATWGIDPGESSITMNRTYYSQASCTGSSYMEVSGVSGFTGGVVFRVGGSQEQLRYVPKSTPAANYPVMSYRETGTGNCVNSNNIGFVGVPVFPNDPGVTGLPNVLAYPAPLRIEVATINEPSGVLLRDGFESLS